MLDLCLKPYPRSVWYYYSFLIPAIIILCSSTHAFYAHSPRSKRVNQLRPAFLAKNFFH